MADTQTLTIDGVDYRLEELSEGARQQVANLRAVDEEIERLQRSLAIAQTARSAYARELGDALPKKH
ncbi:DUF6447 family protein [Halomonas piscis]|uniref:DUF6447 family protein n=1 Tax=Halomonas piscis TaxID=3031727 RepID=A0ABY9Z3H6_9GAMM|nr:DUF6447 family protein [Halomonas piscis]WNK21231.1 DUF6447 family protein [Halomonas piscis]